MSRTKTLLIIGASGYVGTHLALKLREGYRVFGTYRHSMPRVRGVTFLPLLADDPNWARRTVYAAQPDVIIYVAGSCDIDWAEKNSRDSERIHTGGPANISNIAEIFQPKFILVSNCFVFDGHRGNYSESDIVVPSLLMGKHMVGGENFIRGRCLNYNIVRSSPLYGRGNGRSVSLVDQLRMRLDRGKRVDLPTYSLHSFAPMSGFTELIGRLVESGPKNRVLHYGGLTKLSAHDFGKKFAKAFNYDPKLIIPAQVSLSGGPQVNSDEILYDYSLNSTAVAQSLKVKPLLLEEGFDLLQQELVSSS